MLVLNSSRRKNTCLQLVFNVNFPTLLVKTGTWDRKSQFSVAAPIFYCPYMLRKRGRPERPVPSRHFQSPHKGLRASAWSTEVRMCLLAVTMLPYGCPPPRLQCTHLHTYPAVGRWPVQLPSRLLAYGPAPAAPVVRFPSECAGLKP